jgi:CheY-like chemotaxis protein
MALPEDRQRCLAAGVTGCLVKPVTGADLLISVAHQAGLTCRESGSDDAASR